MKEHAAHVDDLLGFDSENEEPNEEVEGEEAQEIKQARDPMLPSTEEVEAHRRTHIPFRCWCKFCIMGRGNGNPHSSMTYESRLPVVCIDYFFVTEGDVKSRAELDYPQGPNGVSDLEADRENGKILKCIVIKCMQTKVVFAHVVPGKGVDEHKY